MKKYLIILMTVFSVHVQAAAQESGPEDTRSPAAVRAGVSSLDWSICVSCGMDGEINDLLDIDPATALARIEEAKQRIQESTPNS